MKCETVAIRRGSMRYVTRETYLFPRTHRIGFPKVAARQYADARAAIRGSSARQFAGRQRGMRGRSEDLEEVRG